MIAVHMVRKASISTIGIVFLALALCGCVNDDPIKPAGGPRLAWERIYSASYRRINCSAIDPAGTIFLGLTDSYLNERRGIFCVSADNGATWIEKKIDSFAAMSLAVDSEGRLFAVGNDDSVWRSADHGASWESVGSEIMASPVREIVVDEADRIYIPATYGGFYVSCDHGESWARVGAEIPANGYVNSIAVNSRGCVFMHTTGGFYGSCDGGQNWLRMNVPWGTQTGRIAIDSRDRIFVVCEGDIHASADEGETWTSAHLPYVAVSIYIDGKDRLFACCHYGLFISLDHGGNWASILNYSDGWPHNYRVVANAAGHIFFTGVWGVIRSIDDGASWEMLGFTEYPPADIAADGSSSFFVGMYYGGVYRSDDGLEPWSPFGKGLPNIKLMCIALVSDSNLAAGTANGVYITSVNRSNWLLAGLQRRNIAKIFPLSGDSIAAYTGYRELFLSEDGGGEWRDIGLKGYRVTALLRTREGRLLAGANFGGIFRHMGEGLPWDQMNEGLDDLEVNALAVMNNGHILAGTNTGLFVSSNEGVSWRRFSDDIIPVSVIFVADEDILVGTSRGGILWTRAGMSELRYQNDGLWLSDAIRSIVASPDYHLYVLARGEIFKSTISLKQISSAR